MWDKLIEMIITEHRGKVIGIVLGLLAAIMIITYGFWKSLFIIFCIVVGYVIGKRIDEHKNFSSLINKFLNDKHNQ